MDIQVSSNFKKMTSKAIFAIVLFILVYLILLSLAIGLTILCAGLGIGLIILKPMAITLGIGIGLASLGFFIIVFLFKFLFKKHKIDRSDLIEITEEQEPKLFKFIEEIVIEADTDFPKRVYLSADVNACVFYDSSFWSMFFPIRKNLQIGLGLVNTISEQEFKAILAHEFGHFSQKSMKVGSYVYNVNQVIFNMLYDNESFENMIQSWANLSGYFSFFVAIAVKIIQGIQWVLRKMYDFVNVSYMALSREMEFHADEVAANIAGYLPLKESLLRIDLANHSYNSVLSFYDNKIADNLKSKNIYEEQQFVMNFLAKENQIPLKNNLPLVSTLDLSKYNKSKLNIKNQWASHPSTEERIIALEKLNITKETNAENPAIMLFSDAENMAKQITNKLFSNVSYQENVTDLAIEKFQLEFTETFNKNSFPKEYNGYYDSKNPTLFDLDSIIEFQQNESIDTLFGKEKVDRVYDFIALENDKNVLVSIDNGEFSVKTFDYDGQKYNASEASTLIAELENEIKKISQDIEENDKKIYKFFYQQALHKQNESELKIKYKLFFLQDKQLDRKIELYNNFVNSTNFISHVTPFEEIENNFREISKLEIELKNEIKDLLENKDLEQEISKQMGDNSHKYLSNDWIYFRGEEYNNDNLKILFAAIHDYHYLVSRSYFFTKLNLLNFQIEQLS
jgi:Zn-dependent protease with chaperone function